MKYGPVQTAAAILGARVRRADAGKGDNAHLHPGCALEDVAPLLGLYYRALAARSVAILPDASEKHPERYPDTHTTIRLPERVARFFVGPGDFGWYKIALTHRAAHYAAGTFEFSFDRPARLYAQLCPPDARGHVPQTGKSDLEIFLGLCAQRELAFEVFTVLEDLRVDEWAKRRYPGLRETYALIQTDALRERRTPGAMLLAPRDALANALVRLSLGDAGPFKLASLLHGPMREITGIVARLAAEDATVEDTAEATLRVYSLLVRLPNLAADHGPSAPVDLSVAAPERSWPTQWPEPERNRLEGEEQVATRFPRVAYRDLLGLRHTLYPGAGPLDQQSIYRFTDSGSAASAGARAIAAPRADEDGIAPPPEPIPHDHHDHFAADDPEHAAGALHAHERMGFIYPEWDHVKETYRRHWCCVRESRVDASPTTRYFDETLAAYGALVPELRRTLERFLHEGWRKVRRVAHGDELDLDAAIQDIVDRRAGLPANENVYLARVRQSRDIALALLVDVSSSTAEHLVVAPGTAAPPQTLHGRSYRTLIDLEKESVALLMAALEVLGDAYGVYCFSGTGRADVKFQVLKDLNERFSKRVAGRLDRVKPLHTTRMGAAIRHASAKLRGHEAKTKILILLSDGRPFDLDYGQDYGEGAEVEYAIRDTGRALEEARALGIKPYVLTVDTQGEDYLRALGEGLGYEVIGDVHRLPLRLLELYRQMSGQLSA